MTPCIRPELARRLVLEAQAVQAKFPGRFKLLIDDRGRPVWTGGIPIEGHKFPVIITYPPAYPALPPQLGTTVDLPRNCPHVLGRSEERSALCWIAGGARSPHRRWQPQRHTAATVLRAAQRWFLAYLVWQTVGEWPVADAVHVA